jgi:hypothetical protein
MTDNRVEVITPAAFAAATPAVVPVCWGQDGPVIGEATVTQDEAGLNAVMRVSGPAPEGAREDMSLSFASGEPDPELPRDPLGARPPRIRRR